MARRTRFFISQIEKEKDHIPMRPLYDSAPLVTVGPRAARTIDELDEVLAEHEARLLQMNESYKTLGERTKQLVEARHVLRETAVFFDKASGATTEDPHILILLNRRRRSSLTYGHPSTRVRLHCFNTTSATLSTRLTCNLT